MAPTDSTPPHTSPNPILLCADDYAISPAVSAGILELAIAGRLSAASAMTTLPDWPRAAQAWAQAAPQAQLGLHLNLTLGKPITTLSCCESDGSLPKLTSLLTRLHLNDKGAAEIEREAGAQIDRFIGHMGRPPDFIDGHQHVQMFPAVRPALFAAIKQKQLPPHCWIRNSADRPERTFTRNVETPKALTLAMIGFGFTALVRKAGMKCNNGFSGFSAFDPKRDYAADFSRYLVSPGPSQLIMCHPGHIDQELRDVDPVVETRAQELSFLLSDRFWETLASRNAKLIRPKTGLVE